jgi:hypothetical protein
LRDRKRLWEKGIGVSEPTILEFLFTGPLFSVFKGLNQIRRDIMGLKEQIDGYTAAVDANTQAVTEATTEFASELEALTEKLANAGAIDPDVQASLDKLGQSVQKQSDSLTALAGVERPTAAPTPEPPVVTPPTIVPPADPSVTSGTVATDSPGEPQPDQSPPSDVPLASGTGTVPMPTDSGATGGVSDVPAEPTPVPTTVDESGSPTTEVTPEENV